MTPEERHHRARLAALTRWGKQDPKPAMRKAREAQYAAFLREADPDGTLPDAERKRRADALWRANLARMALASAAARRRAAES